MAAPRVDGCLDCVLAVAFGTPRPIPRCRQCAAPVAPQAGAQMNRRLRRGRASDRMGIYDRDN